MKYLTVATDNGVNAVGIVGKMFPEEKTKAVLDKVEQYNGLKKKRPKDGFIDEEQLVLATDIAQSMAQLEPEWQTYVKEKADRKKLFNADRKLALAVMADAKAAMRAAKIIPELTGALMDPVKSLTSLITNTGNIKKAKKVLGLVKDAKENIPLQQKAFTRVGFIVKNISGAEGVGLKKHSDDDVQDEETLEKNVSETDEE